LDNLAASITEATTNRTLQANTRTLGEKIQQEDRLAEVVKWLDRFLEIKCIWQIRGSAG
jgi:hypothetical protein